MAVAGRQIIRSIARAVLWGGLKLATWLPSPGLLAFFYARLLRQVPADERTQRLEPTGGRPITILALSPERYRSDTEILAATGRFRVLSIGHQWQTRLIYQFYPHGRDDKELMNPGDSEVDAAQQALRAFLRPFLRALYRRTGVDCVLSAGVHYVADFDWGVASKEIGVPFIVLHRENLLYCEGMVNHVAQRLRRLGRFQGSHIIVHNRINRQTFIDTGYVEPERIASHGCLRMDAYLRRIETEGIPPKNPRRRLIFFAFDQIDTGMEPFFYKVYGTIAKLAVENPDIEVIVKPKPKTASAEWMRKVQRSLEPLGRGVDEIENLQIRPFDDAQDLILGADVVTAFHTTTVFEAAVAGRPVVIPCFDEIFMNGHEDHIPYGDDLAVFDVAHDAAEYERLLLERLRNPVVGPETLAARRAAFGRWISSPEGDATRRYTAEIERIVRESKRSAAA